MVPNDRLKQILREAQANDPVWLKERAEMARELLAHRQRNQRLAAVLEGNRQAVYHEYARYWMAEK